MSGVLASIALAATRAWACLRVQASWRAAIGPSWEWISAALAVVLAGLALATGRLSDPAPPTTSGLIAALIFELGLGTVIGQLASLPGWALVGAGQQSEAELGVQTRAGSGGALTRVVVAASLAAGLSLGLHGPLLASALELFDTFALGQPDRWLALLSAQGLAHASVTMTVLALALVTPVLLTRALVELCLVSLGRGGGGGADGLLAVVGPGLRLSAALVALGAAWSSFPEAFARGM